MRWVLIACALALGGCVAPEERCAKMGYDPGTQLFLQCVSEAAAQQQRAAEALMIGGALLQQSAQPQYYYQAPTTTTCRWMGGQYVCNTW